MKQGKLTNQQLRESILSRLAPQNAETVVGAGIGEDCCAIDTGGLVVVSTDPVTAATDQAGAIAMHVNANDVAAAGAVPVAALVTMLIPTGAEQRQVDRVVTQLVETARALSVDITGGHTEVTDSVNRIVLSVTMLGRPVIPGKVFKTADMRAGDEVVMTKYAGLEGTAIIAADFADELEHVLDETDRAKLAEIQQSLSVVKEGVTSAKIPGVSAMHDITEGGLLGALNEMCEAAGVAAIVDLEKVPVLDVTRKLCAHYGIDVFGLISSGSMLICAADGKAVVNALAREGIAASVIGRAVPRGRGNLPAPGRVDELYKVIEKSDKNGIISN